MTWERVAEVVWRRTFDGVIVLSAGSEDVLHLTGAASTVWLQLAEPASAVELASEMADVYGVELASVRPDVDEVVAMLGDAGLIRSSSEGGSAPG